MKRPDLRKLAEEVIKREGKISTWRTPPEIPTRCSDCGSDNFIHFHYMVGMTHQGWKCFDCEKIFWTHTGVSRPVEEMMAEHRKSKMLLARALLDSLSEDEGFGEILIYKHRVERELREHIDELDKALRFYAQPINYSRHSRKETIIPIMQDAGYTARVALNGKE